MKKRIGILTSGGDSPGMNNTIRSIIRQSKIENVEPYVILEGYRGIIEKWIYPAGDYNYDSYINSGGSFIGSSRYPEFMQPEVREQAKKILEEFGIDSLVVIGGNGSYQGAQLLHKLGVNTIALPGTIDNDIVSTDFTIGYPTALQTIVDAVDKARDTMNSHKRALIVEVMGHGCGDLALFSGLATGAEIIVTNDNVLDVDQIANIVKEQMNKPKKRSVIIIVSEFIYPDLKKMAEEIEQKSGIITRSMALSYIQRGGNPTAIERINATRLGIKAVELIIKNQSGLAVGIIENKLVSTPIEDALHVSDYIKEGRKRKSLIYNSLNQV